ncbi:MAG TPA: hypothetical protein VGN12_02335 [Pirellulales bacterium]|jgi:hypothetical protein
MQYRLCIACCFILAIANVALADGEVTAQLPKPQSEVLVIGDVYNVDSVCGPTRIHIKGRLYKANEKWIVLGTLVLLPEYGHKLFLQLTWFSRDVATVTHHGAYQRTDPVIAVEDEYPRTDSNGRVMVSDGKSSKLRMSRVVGVKDSCLVLPDEKISLRDVFYVRTIKELPEPQMALPAEQAPGQDQQGTGGDPGD